MYATNQFKKGLKLEIDGVPFSIVEFQHISPGKGGAFTRTKLRNLINNNIIERTFKSGEKIDRANTAHRDMQFLYKDAAGFHFMDTSTYEQFMLDESVLGDQVLLLQENLSVIVLFYNDRAIAVELPNFIEATVVQTDPAFKGDTVSGGSKPAMLDTGASVQVPFHIKEGDMIKVDTRDLTYVEKVKK